MQYVMKFSVSKRFSIQLLEQEMIEMEGTYFKF